MWCIGHRGGWLVGNGDRYWAGDRVDVELRIGVCGVLGTGVGGVLDTGVGNVLETNVCGGVVGWDSG